MVLFDFESEAEQNLLPKNGEAYYYGKIFSEKDAKYYFDTLLESIDWKHDELTIFGKKIITKRKVAWYGTPGLKYTYSKTIKTALPWTAELLKIKKIIEDKTGESYNSCLLNLYHSGEEAMGWHSDDEKDLKKNAAIASLSLGAERKFVFKHKESKESVSKILEDGSLLLMGGSTQSNWLHRLPPTKKVLQPRINLTFRTIEIG